MTAIVPFEFNAPAPQLAKPVTSALNKALITSQGPSYPTLSIKGKVFTLVKDDTRKVLTRQITNDDGSVERMPLTSIPLTIVNGNGNSRVYFDKGFVEGEENQSPVCFSHDGKTPDAMADQPQAKNCQVCPHAKWGSKLRTDNGEAKGTACAPRTRLAVADPSNPTTPFLLNLPPASRPLLSAEIKKISAFGKEANEVAFRVSFDMEAATPKLHFAAFGVLSDEALAKVKALQSDPVVLEIIGTPTPVEEGSAPTPAPQTLPKLPAAKVSDEEIDGALSGGLSGGLAAAAAEQAQAVTAKAKAKAEPKPVAKAKAEPKPDSKPVAEPAGDVGDILSGLNDLLGTKDD